MGNYTVFEIIDGDTFRTKSSWIWRTMKGDIVRPTGYDAPEKGEPGYEEAKNKLDKLINGKVVTLKNPVNVSYGRLVCDVYFEGKNLADYFPEYKL